MRLKNISYHPPVPTEQPTTAYRIRLTHGYKPMPTVQTTNALYARPLHTVHLQVTNAHCTTIYSKKPTNVYTGQQNNAQLCRKPSNARTVHPANNTYCTTIQTRKPPMLILENQTMLILGNQTMLPL